VFRAIGHLNWLKKYYYCEFKHTDKPLMHTKYAAAAYSHEIFTRGEAKSLQINNEIQFVSTYILLKEISI